jgi:CNT family concentrative nucleoside transporter
LAWLMGVSWAESPQVGTLIGIKTAVNEFVGYVEMEKMVAAGQLSPRAQAIATYALCGFSNFSSIAIQIGGIGAMAPSRKADLARLGLRAMVAGSLACFQTAAIAGFLL